MKQQTNSQNMFNDLTTSILIRLHIQEGNELVTALGYPNIYTNKAAIKQWVIDHYECYTGLSRQDMLHTMCQSIQLQVHEHFGVDMITMH